MSKSMAKIWARRIYAGTRTLDEVEEKYGQEGVDAVKQAYLEIYGEEI
jgi:hypothetical protein